MNYVTEHKKLDLANQILKFQLTDFKSTKTYISLAVLLFSGIYFLEDLYIDLVVEDAGDDWVSYIDQDTGEEIRNAGNSQELHESRRKREI